MKRIIAVLLLSVMLVSCGSVTTDESLSSYESASDSSASDTNSRAETVQDGDTKITYDYRDGMNDFTVTYEDYHSNGSVSKKIKKDFLDGVKIYEETVEYDTDGTIILKHVTKCDDSGKPVSGEKYYVSESLIQTADYTYDNDKNINGGNVKYTDLDGVILASGTLSHELLEAYKCCVENLTVYENGKPKHLEKLGYLHGKVDYVYRAISDLNDCLLYVNEEDHCKDKSLIWVYGDIQAWFETTQDQVYLYDMGETTLVISGTLNPDQTLEVGFGTSYDTVAAIERCHEVRNASDQYIESMFVYPLGDDFHLQ